MRLRFFCDLDCCLLLIPAYLGASCAFYMLTYHFFIFIAQRKIYIERVIARAEIMPRPNGAYQDLRRDVCVRVEK